MNRKYWNALQDHYWNPFHAINCKLIFGANFSSYEQYWFTNDFRKSRFRRITDHTHKRNITSKSRFRSKELLPVILVRKGIRGNSKMRQDRWPTARRNYRSPRPGNGVQDITLGDDSRVGGRRTDFSRSSPASELGDGGHRCRGANAITRGYTDKSSRANRSSSAALYQCYAA
jgi:hypothetical protein